MDLYCLAFFLAHITVLLICKLILCFFELSYSFMNSVKVDDHAQMALIDHSYRNSESFSGQKRPYGGILDANNLRMLEEKRDIFFLLSFILHNTKPVGHQVFLVYFYNEFGIFLL